MPKVMQPQEALRKLVVELARSYTGSTRRDCAGLEA